MVELSSKPSEPETSLEKIISQTFHQQAIQKLYAFIKSPSNYISKQAMPLKPYYLLQLCKFTEKQLQISSYYLMFIIIIQLNLFSSAKSLDIILSSKAFGIELLSICAVLTLLNALIVLSKKLKGTYLSSSLLTHFRKILAILLSSSELTKDQKQQIEELMLHSEYNATPLLEHLSQHPDWTQICQLAKHKDINTRIQAISKIQDLFSYTISFEEQLTIIVSDQFQTCWGNLLEQPPSQGNVVGNPWENLIKEICKLLTLLIGQFEFIIKLPKVLPDISYWVLLSDKSKYYSQQAIPIEASNFRVSAIYKEYKQQCQKLITIIPIFCLQILERSQQSSLILNQIINILQRVYIFSPKEELSIDSPLLMAIKKNLLLIEQQDDILQKKEASMFLWRIMKDNFILAKELKNTELTSLQSNSYYSSKIEQQSFWMEEAQSLEELVIKSTIPIQLTIPAGKVWSQFIEVNNSGDLIYVAFAIQQYDIAISLHRILSLDKMEIENTIICKEKKVGGNGEPIKLVVVANQPGIYKLTLNNAYSWYTAKVIRIRVLVLENQNSHKQVVEEIKQNPEITKQEILSQKSTSSKRILPSIFSKFYIIIRNDQIEFQLKSLDNTVEIMFEFDASKINKSRIYQKIHDFLKKIAPSIENIKLTLQIIVIYNEEQFKEILSKQKIDYQEQQLKDNLEQLFKLNQFLISSIKKLSLSYQFFKDIDYIYFSEQISKTYSLKGDQQLALLKINIKQTNNISCNFEPYIFSQDQGILIDFNKMLYSIPNAEEEKQKTFKQYFEECTEEQKLLELLLAFIEQLCIENKNIQYVIFLEEQEQQEAYFQNQINQEKFQKICSEIIDKEVNKDYKIQEKISFEFCTFNDLIN